MGYRHSREDILAAAVASVAATGIGGLTFKAVARRLAIADRTVVYYFPTKHDLVVAVLDRIGRELREVVASALGEQPARAGEMLARAWAALSTERADAPLRVYFELVGLAASGDEFARRAAADVTAEWVGWVEARLDEPAHLRGAAAAGVVAQLDGLLLLRLVGGADVADSAAGGLGLTAK